MFREAYRQVNSLVKKTFALDYGKQALFIVCLLLPFPTQELLYSRRLKQSGIKRFLQGLMVDMLRSVILSYAVTSFGGISSAKPF